MLIVVINYKQPHIKEAANETGKNPDGQWDPFKKANDKQKQREHYRT
jgi:hypothetical protein